MTCQHSQEFCWKKECKVFWNIVNLKDRNQEYVCMEILKLISNKEIYDLDDTDVLMTSDSLERDLKRYHLYEEETPHSFRHVGVVDSLRQGNSLQKD